MWNCIAAFITSGARDILSNPEEKFLETIVEQLKSTIGGRRSFETSQIKIIGLTDIKRRAGAEWPAFAGRIREISKHFIESRLDKKDIVIPAGDGFVVIYMSPEDSQPKAIQLQQALNTFYLGDEGLNTLRAEVHAQSVEPDHLVGMLSRQAMRAPESGGPLGLSVLPVWSTGQETVTGYWITPFQSSGGQTCYGYDESWRESGCHGPKLFVDVDQAILRRAVASVEHCLRVNRPCLIGYSVHATTMQHRERRQALLQQLFAVPDHVRPYLLGRIAEVEPGTPKALLAEWIHHIRPVTQRISVELHPTEPLISGLDDIGLQSVACVLPPLPLHGPKVERCARLIRAWHPLLKRQGLRFRVDNVNSNELLTLAAEDGVAFCSGERLWPAVEFPQGIWPYTMAQLRVDLSAKAGA